MEKIIETKRLYLRELRLEDSVELGKILTDPESMAYYPRPYTSEEVKTWIERNIDSYQKNRHGLWAVVLKEGNRFIGDCGITIQDIDGERLPELGYRINKNYCNKGYATEAAKGCMDYAFSTLNIQTLYTYTDSLNVPSMKVAEKNGMKFVRNFTKEVMGKLVEEVLYSIELKPAC